MYLLYKNVSNFIICLTLCVKFYYLNVSNLCYVIWYRIKHKAGGVKWQRKQKWVIKVATLFRKKLMSKVFPIEKRGKTRKRKSIKVQSYIQLLQITSGISLSFSSCLLKMVFEKVYKDVSVSSRVNLFIYIYDDDTKSMNNQFHYYIKKFSFCAPFLCCISSVF